MNSIAGSRLRWRLYFWAVLAAAVVLALGYGREIGLALGMPDDAVGGRLFSLNYERNVPAWFSVLLLFSTAGTMLRAAYREFSQGLGTWLGWLVLGIGFIYLGIDEQLGIHERLGRGDDGTDLTNFSWVKFAVPGVLVLGLLFIPFLRRIPRPTAARLVWAGVVYVVGAVGWEIADGWILVTEGTSVLHTISICIEETMEMLGALLALRCMLMHLELLDSPGNAGPDPA